MATCNIRSMQECCSDWFTIVIDIKQCRNAQVVTAVVICSTWSVAIDIIRCIYICCLQCQHRFCLVDSYNTVNKCINFGHQSRKRITAGVIIFYNIVCSCVATAQIAIESIILFLCHITGCSVLSLIKCLAQCCKVKTFGC